MPPSTETKVQEPIVQEQTPANSTALASGPVQQSKDVLVDGIASASIGPKGTPEHAERSNVDQITPSKDPYSLRNYKLDDVGLAESTSKLSSRRQTRVKKYCKSIKPWTGSLFNPPRSPQYRSLALMTNADNRQNALIDAYLGSNDEETLEAEDNLKNGGKVRFAVNASFACNFCLFVIQLYAAISTGSPALFATAADAFVSHLLQVPLLHSRLH
jgi:hypothetical protein